jgi:membrane associated rhomboid family serine protease
MGETERYADYRRKKLSFGDDKNALVVLVGLNAIIFVLIWMIQLLFVMFQPNAENLQPNIANWFRLSANIQDLAHQPWTILSFMFTHSGFLFTVINMIWLWTFGQIFQQLVGNNKIIPLYLYGGLAGAAGFFISCYAFPSQRLLIDQTFLDGANASTMAIAVAVTVLSPDYKFFPRLNGGIPIWVLTLVYAIIDLASVAGRHPSYQIAHLSGALIGFLFVFSLRRGMDWSNWMNRLYTGITDLFDPRKSSPKDKLREKVFYKTGKQKPFSRKPRITQDRVDEILDKISQKGYQSLNDDEKDILKRAGESNDLTT